ncbi:MAG: MerR family transcriptional regulator [Kineosporiaceae bacterium]
MTGATPGLPSPAQRHATLTVAAVARRLGVAPATLRTWDRRYGLGPSEHEAGSHRRYTSADVTRLLVMRRLTLEGVAPADAARVALDTSFDAENPPVALLTPRIAGSSPDLRPEPVPRPPDPPPAGATLAALVPGETSAAERAVRGLTRAATALDPDECRRIIRRHLEREGVVAAWDLLVAPVLAAIGARWEVSGQGIETEHLMTEAVVDVMREVVGGLGNPRNARPVVLAAAEDEHHGLPLHILAAALAEHGISTRLFGVRVPRQALAAAVRRIGPSVVVVYAHLPVSDVAQVDDLPRLRPSPLVLLGGPGWDRAATPGGVERVADLRTAVERIERAVGL